MLFHTRGVEFHTDRGFHTEWHCMYGTVSLCACIVCSQLAERVSLVKGSREKRKEKKEKGTGKKKEKERKGDPKVYVKKKNHFKKTRAIKMLSSTLVPIRWCRWLLVDWAPSGVVPVYKRTPVWSIWFPPRRGTQRDASLCRDTRCTLSMFAFVWLYSHTNMCTNICYIYVYINICKSISIYISHHSFRHMCDA